ncbi:glycosyltransferase [Bradyrhizobium sp.]|uniref:glycosyltransferase n=1 Tax=Bradyrhizobium sp. TaxID=376 RepID=UPI0039E5FE81
MRTFGIYLLYPPKVDLRAQGLGRVLAAFLKEAASRPDVNFVVACPSWMRPTLKELFDHFAIPSSAIEIIGPRERPLLLKLFEYYEAYQAYKRRPRSSFIRRFAGTLKRTGSRLATRAGRLAATTHNPLVLAALIVLAAPFAVLAYLVLRILPAILSAFKGRRVHRLWTKGQIHFAGLIRKTTRAPQDNNLTLRLYRFMEEAEARTLNRQINLRRDVRAWYSPTAFWPQFNGITAPRLICVPDVVLAELPVGFALVNGQRFLETFEAVGDAIRRGTYFTAYSEATKFDVLVDRYQIAPDLVAVIPHGASNLDGAIAISGGTDTRRSIDAYCATLFRMALAKQAGQSDAGRFGATQFIFYASQIRPNKNVLNLIRAYRYLLRTRYISHKLVLTGDPQAMPEIAEYVRQNNLWDDVLFLREISERELAACYRLADLAVNPSLSEGGCPFTFTEALSVGTPAVMARIAVTQEVVTDPELQDMMLFDPYDWMDIARRIEWGLANRQVLLEKQLPLYQELARRSWSDVVDDYIGLLDKIATSPAGSAIGSLGEVDAGAEQILSGTFPLDRASSSAPRAVADRDPDSGRSSGPL